MKKLTRNLLPGQRLILPIMADAEGGATDATIEIVYGEDHDLKVRVHAPDTCGHGECQCFHARMVPAKEHPLNAFFEFLERLASSKSMAEGMAIYRTELDSAGEPKVTAVDPAEFFDRPAGKPN